MKSNITIRKQFFKLSAAFLITTLGAAAAVTVLDDDLVLEDRDGLTNPENVTLYFAEDALETNTVNAVYSWQSEIGAWAWGYDDNSTDRFTMLLSDKHVLTLYNTDTTTGSENEPTIILNPGDGALGNTEASITIDGDKVVTEGNSVTLLDGDFMRLGGSSSNQGSADSFLLGGTHGGLGSIPAQGAGSRMMWYPEKSAFRVGNANGTEWDNNDVGNYSVAMGQGSTASGDHSFALSSADATGLYSIAMGFLADAADSYSVSIGYSTTADGYGAMALGYYAYAEGEGSVALGAGATTVSTSQYATAIGYFAYADKYHSVAIGDGASATGDYSAALGAAASANGEGALALARGKAHGDYSMAALNGSAYAYGSFALGFNAQRYTVAGQTAWQGDDQNAVLEVGVGTSMANGTNALTVLQDGSVEVGNDTNGNVPLHVKADGSLELGKDATNTNTSLTISASGDVTIHKAQGDISMGAFGN